MPNTALMVGGPCHMKKMRMPNAPPQWEVRQLDPVEAALIGPVTSYDEVPVRTLTYRPRDWFGNEVWVLDGLTDSAAMDMLLTSAFSKRRR